jgi:catechol 2,3-dioxygenase-like lactoylglutathione lyase family enzyme
MQPNESVPTLVQVVLDTTDARRLAEFYRRLLGFTYRSGDEPPTADQSDKRGQDWLVIHHSSGAPRVAFQQVKALQRSTWPEDEVPQQLHLDLSVRTLADFEAQHERALGLGATLLYDRSQDPQEPLRVYADPDGHPFCIFVAGQ